MASEEEAGQDLARRGLRATRQRVAVLRLLRRHRGHPTALEVHGRLLAEHPSLSQKTVYEVLDSLVAAGLASRVVQVGGASRYEARLDRHYHVHCRACGRLLDVPAGADAPIRGRTPLPEGFRVETIHVTLEGVCLRCRDEI
jgi:Fur family peroxide stress response transcriptional regulator